MIATRPRFAAFSAKDNPAIPLPSTKKSNCFIVELLFEPDLVQLELEFSRWQTRAKKDPDQIVPVQIIEAGQREPELLPLRSGDERLYRRGEPAACSKQHDIIGPAVALRRKTDRLLRGQVRGHHELCARMERRA